MHRELSLDDYFTILRRGRWLIIVPAILGAVVGCAVSLILPRRYTSHTAVLVEQPIIPDSYVKPVVSEDLQQRLVSMQEEILSRARLEPLVKQFGLYKNDADRVPMEVLVARLRTAIKVTPLNAMPGTQYRALPGFSIDVTLGESQVAQQICADITSMFTEQSLHLHQQQAEDTTQFLAKQLEEAKARLDEQDAKLADFQSRHIGELPDDDRNNLTLLTGMNPQLEAVTQSLNQARQEKAFVESLLSQGLAALQVSEGGQSSQTLEQKLSDLQNQLLTAQSRYTAEHPDVVKLKTAIAELQRRMRDTSARDQGQLSDNKATIPAIEPPQIQQLRAQLHQFDLTIAQRENEQQQLQRQLRTLQGRIQLSPVVQQEYKLLTRDYQTALGFYNDLLKKRNESQMATELERRQEGEQFRVLDPPSLPERPSFPNRPLFALGGLGAGLALGAGLVYWSELCDKSIRTRRDVESYLGVPALVLIPSVERATKKQTTKSDAVERLRIRTRTAS